MQGIKLFKSTYLILTLLLSFLFLFLSPIAFAQTGAGSAPNVRTYVDTNSVDLLTGERIFSFHLVSIGQGGDGLSANVVSTRRGNFNIDRHSYWGAINEYSGVYIVSIGEGSEDFDYNGSSFTSKSQSGSTLTLSGNTYTYTTADGTVALFDKTITSTAPVKANKATLTTVTAPNGQKLYLDYDYQQAGSNKVYLRSVRNNLGYQLKFRNEEADVMAINNRQEYCNPTVEDCGASTSLWAETTFERLPNLASSGGNAESMDYSESDMTNFSNGGDDIETVTDEDLGYTFNAQGRVSSVDVNGALWSYSYSDSGGQRTTSITAPLGGTRVVVSDISNKVVLSDTDAMGRTASYTYDSYNRLKSSTSPSGVSTEYTYDTRGNVTETRVVATNGATLTTKAGYHSSCSNPKTCNKPLWTEDTKGKRTDYTYNATHGGIVSVTGPAPSSGAYRPKVRYYYQNFKAKIKNSAGNLVATTDGIWKLKIVRACATATTCTGSANERVITRNYNTWKNNLPYYSKVAAGDGSVQQITLSGSDIYGNITYSDGPLAGSSDRTYFYYDAQEQRRIGTIGPDPDGTGSLKRQAVRFDYDATGQMMATKSGITSYASLYYLNNMTVKQSAEYEYDSYGRRTRTSIEDSGVIKAVQQIQYDGQGRVQCRAQRMDKDDLSNMPSACVMDNLSDRISKVNYNLSGQVWQQWAAFGTTEQTRVINTYWPNGNLRHIRDPKGRYTRYYYDNFNRHHKTYYPREDGSPTQSGDYTQKYFDQYGRQSSARLRDGKIVSFLRDDLDRIYHVNAPGSDDDSSYSYDLFGRLISAHQGLTIGHGYDALSRLKFETGQFGTQHYQYDAAGRMIKLTYPSPGSQPGLFINYDYNNVGAVTKIRENGATSGAGVLARYIYDDQGRRLAVQRGNGHWTYYGHDDLGRLTNLDQVPATGPSSDHLSLEFEYNPAGQITRRERSTNSYDWDINNLESSSFITNGLNQAISMYSGPITYDDRGNLSAHSGKTYDYDIFNKLTSVAGNGLNVTLDYDAKGRLKEENDNGILTRFAYSGSQLIGEFNQYNTVLRRYVHGPGVDEPIVVYEGSGTANKRWMMADHQGSIIGYTNTAGQVTDKNSYTMEGVPGDNNVGRFGYTGQMWLEGAELYHYKARAYDPQLGRFLQADPIGYGDGLNMYAYVGGDALNYSDPSGMSRIERKCETTVIVDSEGNIVPGSEIRNCTGGGGGSFGGAIGDGNRGSFLPSNDFNFFGGSGAGLLVPPLITPTVPIIAGCGAASVIPAPKEGSNSVTVTVAGTSGALDGASGTKFFKNSDGSFGVANSILAGGRTEFGQATLSLTAGQGPTQQAGRSTTAVLNATAGPNISGVTASIDGSGAWQAGVFVGPSLIPIDIAAGVETSNAVICGQK